MFKKRNVQPAIVPEATTPDHIIIAFPPVMTSESAAWSTDRRPTADWLMDRCAGLGFPDGPFLFIGIFYRTAVYFPIDRAM